ncbi:MAG TPA: 4a-hydroxytetrahydrobiopterin dehydratase [Actinotalea caeni]|uniref:4a-hydroxytetrahydrobiopterin dehydratase n=1 Tax=Actinotalea caeni TaxID=1348467 RepID=UPI002B4AC48C|nr:4a-hydroxytetrahydrobiopterin dehydratase [Actinotalea caeni]HLV55357.1 4a-hydroxytetrahydrobiopterin dehydratase [Actinotalea caeni]
METLTAAQIAGQAGLEDWRVVRGALRTSFATPDMSAGAELVRRVVEAANEANHHPDLGVRYSRVLVDLVTHDAGGLTLKDVEMARTISDIAAGFGLRAEPEVRQVLEVCVDALDIDAVRPFWEAVTGFDVDEAGNLVDTATGSGSLWFQQMDAPRPQRNRLHVDIDVPLEVVEGRLAAALDAGGVLVSASSAPAFWVLADPEGNEACLSTSAGRD